MQVPGIRSQVPGSRYPIPGAEPTPEAGYRAPRTDPGYRKNAPIGFAPCILAPIIPGIEQ